MVAKKRGLGRGLDALLGTKSKDKFGEASDNANSLTELDVDLIKPGKFQPRTKMDMMKLRELADSIKAQGMVQPIIVRSAGKNKYEIIAGERRWRAAQIAEMSKIPVVIRVADDRQTIAMALIENIQREDLNPLEEATALQRLIDEFELTHQQAAQAVGRSRAAVSNLLRLLELHKDVKKLLDDGEIEMGHARALLGLEKNQQLQAAHEVIKKAMSVRVTEKFIKNYAKQKPEAVQKPIDKDIQRLELELAEKLCSQVTIQHSKKGKGKLVINYHSVDELEGILAKIK
ncbi:Chromosome (plasmid) partitioning protein ParB [hydrothermal vent metagenome]|uniref:Chromosome (Plasmid) partitioning protein ParB n=1 Tax=hydrothermal vent metagenome TaxID=652676 RepID=A0A3B0UUX9_9ZZZZ